MNNIDEVAPPYWGHTKADKSKGVKVGGTAEAMKKAQERGDIPKDMNIFALMWSMKNKGDKPHYKPGKKGVLKKKYKGPEGQNEGTIMNNQMDEGLRDVLKKWAEKRREKKAKKDVKNIPLGKDLKAVKSVQKKADRGELNAHTEYKRIGYKIDEILGAIGTGILGGVGSFLGASAARRAFGKSAKKKAEEKRKAKLAAQQKIQPGEEEEEEMEESVGSKLWKGTKETARVAGLVPGAGVAGDLVAGGMTAAQLAVTKDKKKRSSLKKELAGDALAAIPGAGLGTRGAQYGVKGARAAGKAVKGGKGAGKLRSRSAAAVRLHGTKAARAAGEALEHKAREKSKELRQEGRQMRNKYMQALKEARRRQPDPAGETGISPGSGPRQPSSRGTDPPGGEVVSPGKKPRRKITPANAPEFLEKFKKAKNPKVTGLPEV